MKVINFITNLKLLLKSIYLYQNLYFFDNIASISCIIRCIMLIGPQRAMKVGSPILNIYIKIYKIINVYLLKNTYHKPKKPSR